MGNKRENEMETGIVQGLIGTITSVVVPGSWCGNSIGCLKLTAQMIQILSEAPTLQPRSMFSARASKILPFIKIFRWIPTILHDINYFIPWESWYYSARRLCRIFTLNTESLTYVNNPQLIP